MSYSKRTFGLLATVVLAGTLFVGFSVGVMVAKPKAAEGAESTAAAIPASGDLDRQWEDEVAEGDVDMLLSYYASWSELCRGYAIGSDLTCQKREIVGDVLSRKGMCFGQVDQLPSQWSWHTCVANSCRPDEAC